MKRRIIIVGLLLSLIMLAQTGALAAAAPVQVTDAPSNQGRPDIQGSIIVWKDLRAGNWDIYAYNLLTGIEEPVNTDPAYQNVPVTNGTTVAWQDNRSGANDIYTRNLATGVTQLLVSGPGNQGLPAIDGNLIAYVDDALGNNNIFVINIDTGAVTTVSTNPANQWQPRISGNTVVWEDQRNGNWDIYMRNLAGGVEQPVASGPGDQRVADIDGNIVVWQDYTNGRYEIMMKNLATGVSTAVTNNTDYKTSPRVSRDLIAWENYSYADSNYDVLVKDLTSGQTTVAAGGPQIQARPAIDGENLVWEEEGSDGYDVWMSRIPDTAAPVVSGTQPADGDPCGCQAPVISATLADNRTGVDVYSVRLLLDGQDVTSNTQVSDSSVAYQAPALANGTHTATLSIRDIAGNSTSTSWSFSSEATSLKLDFLRSYWGSYTDYSNRELSVDYHVANASVTADAILTEIVAAPSTSGVILKSPTPFQIGPLAVSAAIDRTVKYVVPMSVTSFKTRVFIRAEDRCGAVSYLPGPLPGS